MHSTETINQFLNLRLQGWSFARIADQLHVSKPTLLDWNRKFHSKLDSMKAHQQQPAQETAQASDEEKLENLRLFYTALRQELISRTLESLSTEEIEAFATDIERQIDKLAGKEKVL